MHRLFLDNVKAVGKKFNRTYPKEWIDAQAFMHMVRAVNTFDETKNVAFVTHWINRLAYKLPQEWDLEINLVRYPAYCYTSRQRNAVIAYNEDTGLDPDSSQN